MKVQIENYSTELFVPTLMADLLGFASIAIVCLITLIISLRWINISKIIFTALIVRVIAMFVGYYLLALPDSGADALGFEWGAWTRSKQGFINVLDNFPGINTNSYQWFMAIPYSLFGRSMLMIQSIGLLFGIGSVFLGWFISKKIWDDNTATKVGWVLALFPSLILYSILTLREVYAGFFLLVAILGIVNLYQNGGYKPFLLIFIGFYGATLFHGALLLGGVFFLFILSLSKLKKSVELILVNRINLESLIVISLIFFIVLFYSSNNFYLPHIGTFDQVTNLSYLTDSIKFRMTGEASYSEWTNINSNFELIYKGFIRSIYFLFSPFIWDIKKPSHFIGFLDGLLYMTLVYLIYLNRKLIWKDKLLRIILLILLFYFVIFGIGVSNFGAGIRHRSKFVIEMVILAAPLIPNFVLFNKKKIKNTSIKN